MNDVITINSYKEFEQKFDNVMQETAERFVVIGYLLKVARDTDILRDSGYNTMSEFAQKRYGLTKDIASRYIAINDRYSEGGYSERLDQRYKAFGYAKLAEMLTLPDVIAEELSPGLTKEDIRAIKSEVREEETVSDIEVLLEERAPEVTEIDSLIGKVLHQLCHEHSEIYEKLWVAVNRLDRKPNTEDVLDILAPSGIAVLTCRIPGIGRLMLSVKGTDEPVKIINVRAETKEDVMWEELLSVAVSLAKSEDPDKYSYQDDWTRIYNEEFPKKAEVAPAQPKRVVKSVPKPAKSALTPASEQEEQIPGQREIGDYPGVVPEKNAKEDENEQQKDELSAGATGSDLEDEREERACEEKLEKTDEKTCTEGNESYKDLREAAEELADGVHEVFWGWREATAIPKEELEAALKNAKKLIKKIEQLIERS